MVNRHDIHEGMGADAPEDALRPGDQLLHGQYRIEKYLSAGGFGITYLASDSLKRKVVIKECFPNSLCCRSQNLVRARSSSYKEDFRSVVRKFGEEALRMAQLNHPNIVGVHQVFEDNGTAYMALDFIRGRDLLDIIENDRDKPNSDEIKNILLKLLEAVAYIHERDILHRDISPDNILLDDSNNPVLIDFGAAREVASRASRVLSTMQIVKDGYSPQEFYTASGAQSESSDLYSLAASFYHLITGVAPPNSQVRLAALAAEELDPYKAIPPRTEGYDHFFLGAIDRALAVFPKHRIQTAVEWIEEIDREKRQKAMFERAKKDAEIELSIRHLTAETNEAMLAGVDDDRDPVSERPNSIASIKATPRIPDKIENPKSSAHAKIMNKTSPAPTVRRAAAIRTTSQRDMVPTDKLAPELAASTYDRRFVNLTPPQVRRSLFTRVISVPFFLFRGDRQGRQHKNGGVEK